MNKIFVLTIALLLSVAILGCTGQTSAEGEVTEVNSQEDVGAAVGDISDAVDSISDALTDIDTNLG